jgi:phage gp46-like protein
MVGRRVLHGDGDKIGSRLWLLARAKATTDTARRAEEYAREALGWLVDDKVATKVEATAEITRLEDSARAMILSVAIYRPGATDPARYRFDGVWRAMEE